ncbi:MAG: amidohydrolase family protein [Armatimonadetes bacterium]|jgi:hypothetical protein|nr:amidohydrolase family protein [Armatimonadota bacterium]
MAVRETQAALVQAMEDLPVVDAHEHLPPEKARVESPVDFATLFSHYTQTDLKSAGMTPEDYSRFQAPETDLDAKWEMFEPYWHSIRFGSYSRPALIAAREFYGCDDISRHTYRLLSERMRAANTAGIYKRILQDRCNIRICLTQIGAVPDDDSGMLAPLLPVGFLTGLRDRESAVSFGETHGVQVKDLASYLDAMRAALEQWKAQGVVGVKMVSTHLGDPNHTDAERAFSALMSGADQDYFVLHWFLHQEALRMAGDLGLVVAVHCGIIWDNWNNFYENHPRNLIPILMKHRKTKFDIYHAGIPWPRDLGVIGKDFPNAYLNLCWCHIISQRMTVSLLDEWLDMVPVHKIMGFGGDYHRPVEKVYGHLLMAKEDIARVLAGRIDDGLMTEKQALELAGQLLFDNPRDLYGLDV